jgi:anti-sigma28 factor (negative regulator of flagellin synthesis)
VAKESKGLPPLSPQDISNGVQNKNPVAESIRPLPRTSLNVSADKMNLIPAFVHLQDLDQVPAALVDSLVNIQRVEAIKQSIAQGTYQIDALGIALKLIDLEGSLDTNI